LAGNIGLSPLEILSKVKKGDKVVLELSSFELDDLEQSPNIAVITNIMPDHLNRYAGMVEYIQSKKRIFKYQNENDILVLNADDPIVKEFAKEAKSKVFFSSGQLAIKVAEILGVSEKSIARSVRSFKGVSSRQEFIKEVNGVKYFNDTTATIPEAVIFAINSFIERFPKAKLIFICGGQNKGLNYARLSNEIKDKVGELVMLPGTASEKIKEELGEFRNLHEVPSMRDAVKKASGLAKKGDVVVLSPGAASFNLFKNEFDRGAQFIKFVKELK
jgi:UDP-N-acetylmuramoylalanine--D-glutamate ligase